MKTLLKRTLSFVVAICICFTFIPQISGALADETEPQLSKKCENIIEIEGMDTNFGNAASDLRINSRIKFNEARDFSAFDIIELNIYIENISILKIYRL